MPHAHTTSQPSPGFTIPYACLQLQRKKFIDSFHSSAGTFPLITHLQRATAISESHPTRRPQAIDRVFSLDYAARCNLPNSIRSKDKRDKNKWERSRQRRAWDRVCPTDSDCDRASRAVSGRLQNECKCKCGGTAVCSLEK